MSDELQKQVSELVTIYHRLLNDEARRRGIYLAISRERVYQDRKWGTIEEYPHDIGEWLDIVEEELDEAIHAWDEGNDPGALKELLQAAAVAVACFEQHGVVERGEPSEQTKPEENVTWSLKSSADELATAIERELAEGGEHMSFEKLSSIASRYLKVAFEAGQQVMSADWISDRVRKALTLNERGNSLYTIEEDGGVCFISELGPDTFFVAMYNPVKYPAFQTFFLDGSEEDIRVRMAKVLEGWFTWENNIALPVDGMGYVIQTG